MQLSPCKMRHPEHAGLSTSQTRALDLSRNNLTEAPASLLPRSLVTLSLLGNRLQSIDAGFVRLRDLKKICVAANELDDISPLFACPSLLYLNACHNRLTALNTSSHGVRCCQPCPSRRLDYCTC